MTQTDTLREAATDTIDVAALVERLTDKAVRFGPNGELERQAADLLQSQADALAEARRERDLKDKMWLYECEKHSQWLERFMAEKARATTAEASLATMREALVVAEAVLRNAGPTSTTDGGRIPETTTGEAASIARRALGGSNAE